MAKKGGLDCHISVDGIDLTGDTASLDSLSSPRGTFDKHGLDRKAFERIYGRRDGMLAVTSYWNKATGRAHPTWKTLPTTDRGVMVGFSGSIGGYGAAMQALQIGYDPERSAEGDLNAKIETQSDLYGLDHCRMLTAWPRTDAGATTGAGVDLGGGGSTAFGLQAYLHVTEFTGTDCTIKLQQSSDDGAGDAYADVTGGGFTAVTAGPGTQRIATATNQTVEQYLRVVTTTSGGFASLSFVVMVCRNEATPA